MEPCIHDSIGRWYAGRDSFAFSPVVKIEDRTSVCTGAPNLPLANWILMFEPHLRIKRKTIIPKGIMVFLVRWKGLEPPTY